jgi:hypothetical protein
LFVLIGSLLEKVVFAGINLLFGFHFGIELRLWCFFDGSIELICFEVYQIDIRVIVLCISEKLLVGVILLCIKLINSEGSL